MSASEILNDDEAVLAYCCDKTMNGYEQALHYGRLSGYFDKNNKLTVMGHKVARLLEDDLAA